MNKIANSIINRVAEVNLKAQGKGRLSHHPLYPKAYEDFAPALNVMPEDEFNDLMNENLQDSLNGFPVPQIEYIGTLDFWDEIVEFFSTYLITRDVVYTALSIEDMKAYGLPEGFIKDYETFGHPEGNKYHHYSLYTGKAETTIIVVLGDDITLYKRNW